MDLQTRYVPFWNGISVSNSLILSNLFFCWFFINTVVKNVFAVFYGPDSIFTLFGPIDKIYKLAKKRFSSQERKYFSTKMNQKILLT